LDASTQSRHLPNKITSFEDVPGDAAAVLALDSSTVIFVFSGNR